MGRPQIDLSPAALVLLGLLFYLDPERLALPFFLSCGAHELAHLAVAAVSGGRIYRLKLGCFGAELYGTFRSYGGEVAALVAGPGANLLLALTVREPAYRMVNLYLFCYQMLPLPSLDGGRLWYLLWLRLTDPTRADRAAELAARLVGGAGLAAGLWATLGLRWGLWPLLTGLAVALRAFLPAQTPGRAMGPRRGRG